LLPATREDHEYQEDHEDPDENAARRVKPMAAGQQGYLDV
jgi:hypothetical protein